MEITLIGNKFKVFRSSIFILGLSLLFTISLLIGLIIYEIGSVKEMRHIVKADFKAAIQLSKGDLINKDIKPLMAEVESHLGHKIQTTRYLIAIITLSICCLMMAWFLIYRHIQRLKKIKGSTDRLEELMYYDQLKVKSFLSSKEHLPPVLVQIQQNVDVFLAEITRALKNEEFTLYYQPIVSAEEGHVVEVEALVRWNHPIHGLLMPDFFLSFCEATGLIVELGGWALQAACAQAKKWHEMGYQKLVVSVNLSARQFSHPMLLELITNVLEKTGISPACLQFEITESMIMRDVEENIKFLNTLRNLGLQLALDDFGTGYSSFTYLKQFPFNVVKIDKSFILDMTTNITSVAIVESIVALGKSLGLIVVAEGVENKSQLFLLKKMKCNMIQGFLYSKALPTDELTRFLENSGHLSSHPLQDIAVDYSHSYQYKVLQSEHYDQAVNVITHTFCEYEPMTKYLGITHRDFIPFAELMVDKAIKDGLSIVALDGDKVTACTIVEDIADPLAITINIDSKLKIIFSLLEHLGSDFFNEKIIEKGHLAHLFITAVDKDYFGKGLSRKVNFESIKLAQLKGFDFMCCEFTHHYNEQGTIKNLKNSKLLIRSCPYKDFIFEEKKPFEHLDGSASAYIWALRSGAKFRYHIKDQNS